MGQMDCPHVADTLAQLGVKEIEERMEVSPLLMGGDLQGVQKEGDWSCCSCKMDPNPDPNDPPLNNPPL